MKSEIKKTGGPKVKGMPRSPLSRLPMRSDFKRPGASAANAADCASSIHQMKPNTEEPSNGCLTLVKVGRRTVVRIARRLTPAVHRRAKDIAFGLFLGFPIGVRQCAQQDVLR